jgi:hypothetical protein
MRKYKFECIVILIAAVFAVVTVLPHILQRTDTRFAFRGVEIMPADAEIHYAARMREIYDGYWQTGGVFYAGFKHQPFLQPPFPEAVPALLAKFSGFNPVLVFTFFSALCAFALTLIMTGAIAALSGNKWTSIIAVTTLLFAGFILGAPWDLPRVLAGTGAFEPLRFARPINPLWTTPWFFAVVWLVAAWVRNGNNRLLWYSVLPLVVLVYSYVYAWSYLFIALALLILWYANKRDWPKVQGLLICGCCVALCSVPYLLHLHETVTHPLYPDSSLRFGVVSSHTPLLGAWFFVAIALLALTYSRWKATWPFVATLLVAGMLALNIQVFTGRALVPHHYHWYFFHPLASLLALTFLFQVLDRILPKRQLKSVLAGITLCAMIALGFRFQYLAYETASAYWGEQQNLAAALRYLDEHAPAQSVVYSTDIDAMDLAAIYTPVDVYNATNAHAYLAPKQRVEYALFFDLWLQGVSLAQAEKEFPTSMRSSVGSAIYGIHFREQYGSYNAVPDAFIDEMLRDYAAYLRLSDLEKIRAYRIDFLVLPQDARVTPALKTLLSLSTEVFAADGWTVRQMHAE